MLLAKGYPDIGWNPCGGERYLDFLRFAVFVNGEAGWGLWGHWLSFPLVTFISWAGVPLSRLAGQQGPDITLECVSFWDCVGVPQELS